MKALAAYPHLLPSSTGEATDFVDAAMARHGLVRRVGLRAPLLTAIGALTQSDMIAIVNEDAARAFADLAPLTVLPLPFASPRLPTAMLWHRRFDDVSAHRWLRDLVLRLVRRAPDSDDRRSAAERQSADAADRNPSRDGEEVS